MQPLDGSFSKSAEFFPVLRYLEQNPTVDVQVSKSLNEEILSPVRCRLLTCIKSKVPMISWYLVPNQNQNF